LSPLLLELGEVFASFLYHMRETEREEHKEEGVRGRGGAAGKGKGKGGKGQLERGKGIK
jgi:hypothetical protein